jgi:CAAX prenyl protease-like protein
MTGPAGRIWPYLAPYGVLVGLAELGSWLPALAAPLLAARVVLPALLVLAAWRLGAYPELRQRRAGFLDVLAGLAIAALWLAPYLLWPALPRGEPFDRDVLGEAGRPLWIGLRVFGFVLVSPLVEELFVRSFLHRAVEAWPAWQGFAQHPVGRAHRIAFAVTALWFMLSHSPWEWWVALPTGALLNLWLYRRGSLARVWLAHAVANGALGALAACGPWDLWAFL